MSNKKDLEGFLKKAGDLEDVKQRDALVEGLLDAHDYIQGSYYVSHPNFDLGIGGKVNDVILMNLANAILGRNLLVKGNPGLGKTTTAQAVSSINNGMPIEFVDNGMLQGSPFLTEEKIFGRFDFSKLSDEEKVIFTLFSQTPGAKIVDEINRIPPQTQNALLKAVETGKFGYMDHLVRQKVEKQPFFATANYSDLGNTEMSPPFLDRFDASVEVEQPLWLGSYLMGEPSMAGLSKEKRDKLLNINKAMIRQIEKSPDKADEIRAEAMKYVFEVTGNKGIYEQKARISNKTLADKLYDVFMNPKTKYESKLEKAAGIQEEFNEQIRDISLGREKTKALKTIGKNYAFNPDAQLYWNAFMDHINCIPKISGQGVSNHDKNYPLGQINNELSVRLRTRGRDFTGLISYLKGEDAISVETVEQSLPYLIAHTAVFNDSLKADTTDLSNSLSMRNARQVVKNFSNEVYRKHKEDFENLYGSISNPDKVLDMYADHTEPSIREFVKKFRPLVEDEQDEI